MARIFISHSSKDKEFVRELCRDLTEIGHHPWLDEWEIKVGECISTKIQQGLEGSDYLILVLSKSSVESGWVEREWKDKYWEEVEKGTVFILPVVVQDCDIPRLLKTKYYADFRSSYAVGFSRLVASIDPVIKPQQNTVIPTVTDTTRKLTALIQKAQSYDNRLSQVIAEALSFALEIGDAELTNWCRQELAGYPETDEGDLPMYRYSNVFASFGLINQQYIGWGGIASNVLNHMETAPKEFIPQKLALAFPVSVLEDRASRFSDQSLLHITVPYEGSIPEGRERPNIHLYGSGDTIRLVLSSIRSELSRRLIKLLPLSASL
jgi:hypothetical protein